MWFTAAELADAELPGLPADKRSFNRMVEREGWERPDWQGARWRPRIGRGGGREFHIDVLPMSAKVALAVKLAATDPAFSKRDERRRHMWDHFDRLPDKRKAVAWHRRDALLGVETLVRRCTMSKQDAVDAICRQFSCTPSTLYRWEAQVRGFHLGDWPAALVPHHAGRQTRAEFSAEAWEAVKTAWLRTEKPSLAACCRQVEEIAATNGWAVPSVSTVKRRLDELAPELVQLQRHGTEALGRMLPHVQRDHGVFHALQAVNADGHKWDVFVRWPDGSIGRPMMCAFQDIYSGMILSWRIDRSATREAVRLAFGDLVEAHGIPEVCYFDNGRDFASKQITGGARNRYRFKIRDEDPLGLLPQLGVEVKFTTPYHGQSKPIERAFRDFAGDIAKHPRFEGAYVGNKPDAKPENYGSKAVKLDVFIATLAEEIRKHNDRVGRRSPVCGGKLSFSQAFAASMATATITKASEAQRRMLLLAAEAIGIDQASGSIKLMGNRYWTEKLWPFRGRKVTVRFDPQNLHEPVHIYRADGTYIGEAACQEAVGFADVAAAQTWARRRKALLRTTRELAKVELSMPIEQLAAMLPILPEEAPRPETKVVRPLFATHGSAALKRCPDEEEEANDLDFLGTSNAALRAQRSLTLVGGQRSGEGDD